MTKETKQEAMQAERKLQEYWKPVTIPFELSQIARDGAVETSITLRPPKGKDGRWFRRNMIGWTGEADYKSPDGLTIDGIHHQAIIALSGWESDAVDELEDPDYEKVAEAAFDFFTTPWLLMRFQDA